MKASTIALIRNFSLSLVAGLFFSPALQAQLLASEVMSADYCDVKNPGGSPALKGTRKRDGEIQNILYDFQFTISCPLQLEYGASNYDVAVVALNYNSFQQQFRCVLQEFNISDSLVASYPLTEEIGSGRYRIMSFSQVRLSDSGNRLYMWCSLPPRGALGSLVVDSYF